MIELPEAAKIADRINETIRLTTYSEAKRPLGYKEE